MTLVLADHALVTLDDACDQIGIDVGVADAVVIKTINRASERIASFLGRTLHYSSGIVEKLPGLGGTDLVVSRAPIAAVASITLDGVDIGTDFDATTYAAAGVIFRRGGWAWTARRNPGVSQQGAPGTEEPLYVVTYAGGWWTPAQGPLSAKPATATALPGDVEQAALELVASMYARRGGPGADVASESLMSYSVTYKNNVAADGSWTGGLPADIAAMLAPHRFLVQG